MSLHLNSPAAQRRIIAWAARLQCKVYCDFDTASENSDSLHFIITPQNKDDELVLTAKDSRSFASLGAAFDLQHEADSNELHVYVQQPDPMQASELLRLFGELTRKLKRRTWPYWVSGALCLFGGIILCYAASGLHTHLHQYEAPWETFFEWVFTIPIFLGDTMKSVFAGGESGSARNEI